MFCRECGKELHEENGISMRVCLNCGAPIYDVNNVADEKNSKRILGGLVFCIVFFLGLILPYAVVYIYGVPATITLIATPDGIISLGILINVLIGSIKGREKMLLTGGFIELIILILNHSVNRDIVLTMGRYGIGFLFLFVGSIGMIVYGIKGIIKK